MPTLFQQLENNESMLLMYLAGELPAEDMAEVARMLSADAGLRAELQSLQSAMEVTTAGLAELDRLDGRPASVEAAAVRRVGRAMRQWKVDRLRVEPVEPAARRLRLPGWTYPIGAVASVLLVSLIYWGMAGDNGAAPVPGKPVDGNNKVVAIAEPRVELLQQSLQADTTTLADAESQANSLVARSDDASATSSIFLSDNGQ